MVPTYPFPCLCVLQNEKKGENLFRNRLQSLISILLFQMGHSSALGIQHGEMQEGIKGLFF